MCAPVGECMSVCANEQCMHVEARGCYQVSSLEAGSPMKLEFTILAILASQPALGYILYLLWCVGL